MMRENLLRAADRFLYDRKIREALAAYDRAEAQGSDPDKCCGGRWMCWMLTGDSAQLGGRVRLSPCEVLRTRTCCGLVVRGAQ
jgi:hypothetical protein